MGIEDEEYLIQSIRSGTVRRKNILIVPATIDQLAHASFVYAKTYEDAINKGIMTEEGLENWMIANSILPSGFHSSKDNFLKSIDNLKKSLFLNRLSKPSVKTIRSDLINTRSKLASLLEPKSSMSMNTCEFIAQAQKINSILHTTVLKDNKPYRPSNNQPLLILWNNSLLPEPSIRALARSSFWKAIWSNRGFGFDLFTKRKNTDLTINQRNLLTWSRIYDNVQESLECPTDDVINDDDMLDGWFILQKEKREKEQRKQEAESLLNNSSSKMSKASHVFVSESRGVDINSLNDDVGGVQDFGSLVSQAGSRKKT